MKTKQVKLKPYIAVGDLGRKIDNIKKYLSKGDRVKVTMTLKGRQKDHLADALVKIEGIIYNVREYGTPTEGNVDRIKGDNIVFFLTPLKNNKGR